MFFTDSGKNILHSIYQLFLLVEWKHSENCVIKQNGSRFINNYILFLYFFYINNL